MCDEKITTQLRAGSHWGALNRLSRGWARKRGGQRRGGEGRRAREELTNQSERLRAGLPLHSCPRTTLSPACLGDLGWNWFLHPHRDNRHYLICLIFPSFHLHFNGSVFFKTSWLPFRSNSFWQHWTLSPMSHKRKESGAFPLVPKWVPCILFNFLF